MPSILAPEGKPGFLDNLTVFEISHQENEAVMITWSGQRRRVSCFAAGVVGRRTP
jgi:hypothetical protein